MVSRYLRPAGPACRRFRIHFASAPDRTTLQRVTWNESIARGGADRPLDDTGPSPGHESLPSDTSALAPATISDAPVAVPCSGPPGRAPNWALRSGTISAASPVPRGNPLYRPAQLSSVTRPACVTPAARNSATFTPMKHKSPEMQEVDLTSESKSRFESPPTAALTHRGSPPSAHCRR